MYRLWISGITSRNDFCAGMIAAAAPDEAEDGVAILVEVDEKEWQSAGEAESE